jgi:hypothetical protein
VAWHVFPYFCTGGVLFFFVNDVPCRAKRFERRAGAELPPLRAELTVNAFVLPCL